MKRLLLLGLAVVAGAGLSGCLVSQVHLSNDFGAAAHQDIVAQITNPDARYPGPPPPSSGPRVALAQKRYNTGTTIPPAAEASDIGMTGGSAAPPVGGAGMGVGP